MAYAWRIDPRDDGVLVQCMRKGFIGAARTLPLAQWPDDRAFPGRALLDFLVEAERASRTDDGVLIPHSEVAAFSEDQAQAVGLPPAVPHALGLRSHGTLDQPDFAVEARWLKHGSVTVRLVRQGSIAWEADRQYRVPLPLLRILEAAEALAGARPDDRAERVQLWLPLQHALAEATGARVRPDGYLEDLKIFHAASFSLSVDMAADKGITFEPTLFGRAVVRKTAIDDPFLEDEFADPAAASEDTGDRAGLDVLLDEADQLLPPDLQDVFVTSRFGRDEACRESYPLARNTYLVIDGPLRRALDVVRIKQRASKTERRAFVKNPRSALAEALGVADDSREVSGLFVETQQYAERVTGIGLWEPKVLPWLPKAPNTWLPEKIGFRIGDRTVEIAPESLSAVEHACSAAMAAGHATFSHGGANDIPATEETLAAISSLRPTAERMLEPLPAPVDTTADAGCEEEPRGSERFALEQADNLEEETYSSGDLAPRAAAIAAVPPEALLPQDRLFPHQREGFDWLVRCWSVGRPGVLLADDMGLGKTVQTLAFAAWLHAHHEARGGERGPILIVAPTALLRNWEAEHARHLRGGGIGPIASLYGGAVRQFRKEGEEGRDVTIGHGVLDRDVLMGLSVILTTYETLANYHISLAALRFPLVVFDEIQKLKTPTTINTHAAKTINADFVIGLTGTPVENSLSELWSIMDRLHPGLLHDLKSFNRYYRPDAPETLRELRDLMVKPVPRGAPVMLRRMKDTTDLGKALPPRQFHSLPADMPPIQADAYADCIADARREKQAGARKGAMLKVLQRMRSLSLHPEHPKTVLGRPGDYDTYVSRSARLITTMAVLEQIADRREKALIFIEYREMQDVVADIVRHRFGLSHLPSIINGATASSTRQALVDRFQAGRRDTFDVMILAPRAAGIGLTITAANHVIHLSRWWNPAVEDQCNDRAYRIGQDKPVDVYYPIARHPGFGDASFDVSLDRLLDRKRKLSRDLLVPAESEDDYRELFAAAVGEQGML